MKILVGSKNPVKIQSVKDAFANYFDNIVVESFSVNSNVPEQPVNDDTFTGAKNRVNELKKIDKDKNLIADFFVGIEGGIMEIYSTWFAFGCMCIADKNSTLSFGTSPLFELPDKIIKELLKGKELGLVMDEMTGENNTKHKEGAIGYFTNGVMNRTQLYIPGLITALIPFLHKAEFDN